MSDSTATRPLVLGEDNFEEQVLKSDRPVLVDFWAPWCGPCRAVGPIVDELAEEFAGRAAIGKVNVDEQRELAMRFGVQSIPALLVFEGGAVVDSVIGAVPKSVLESRLKARLEPTV